MCSGYPTNPFGYSMGHGYQVQDYQQMLNQQMWGMQGAGGWGPGSGATINPQTGASWSGPPKPKPKKRCVCAYCGRPIKMDQDETCKGCGAWEVEFK